MKNQLLALSTVIGVMITGGITFTPTLLPPAQAVTITHEGNGTLAIGVGKNVRITKDKSINIPQGTKIYFVCMDNDLTYDYYQISPINVRINTTLGSRSSFYRLSKKGKYLFNITNLGNSYNDSITVIVK